MNEPLTHYDENDSHGYHMHSVVDPPELNDLPLNHEYKEGVLSKCCSALVTQTGYCTFCWEQAL